MSEDQKPPLSIIIPIYNEKENISDVITEVIEKVTPLYDLDLIIIDDGSEDDVISVLVSAKQTHPLLQVASHPKRSGKSAALRTGMLLAKHLWVATMDGDGQDDPQNILNMAETINTNQVNEVGLVAGNRTSRTDGNNRKIASKMANGLRKNLLKDNCPDTACGLKIIPKELFLALPFFDALHRYLPALTNHLGFKTINVPVTNRPRASGQSKYSNIGRAFAGLFDLFGVVWLMKRTQSPAPHFLMKSSLIEKTIK